MNNSNTLTTNLPTVGRCFAWCAALLAAGLLAPATHAANIWDGGGADDSWGTADNWDDNVAPVNLAPLTFAGGTRLTPTNDVAGRTNSITFDGSAGAFTLGGEAVVLTGGITNNSTSPQTINFAITNGNATRSIFVTSGGSLTINGAMSGTGAYNPVTGGGTLTLNGTNTHTGAVTISTNLSGAGTTVVLGSSNALTSGGGLVMHTPTYLDLKGNNQTIFGFLDGIDAGSGNTTQSGTYITNSSATQVTLTITNFGNNFRFRQANIGGNLKLVLTANNVNGNANGAPGSGFQAQVPGNTFSGGTEIKGLAATTLTTTNFAAAGGFNTSGNICNAAVFRFFNSSDYYLSGGQVFGTGPITLDNGELWNAGSAQYVTNPITVTARGGILRSENSSFRWWGPISGSGLLAVIHSQATGVHTFSNDFSGFTGTLAVDTGSGAGLGTLNLCSNSPSGDLLFWGNGSRAGTVQWNGDSSAPATLSFTRVNSGVNGGLTTVGRLSSGNATTVTYQLGDNTATTNLFGGYVTNGAGTVGVTKIGSNTQILAGANAHTGPTIVGGGTLRLTGANDGSGGCTVSNNATLSFGGTGSLTSGSATVNVLAGGTVASGGASIGGLVTLSSGNAAINLQDNTVNTNTLAGGLTLDNGNILSFDLGSASDVIAIIGGTYTKNAGTVTVNVAGTGFAAGTYPLITGASIVSTNGYALGSVPSNPSFTYALVVDSGNLALQVSLAVVSPANAHWKGGVDDNWSTADSGPNFNWATTSAGTTSTGAKPGVTTAVTFSAAGAANQTTVLGGNFEINSLAQTTSANVGIGGNNSLQIDSGGVSISAGAGNLTISNSSLVLGGAQLWTNNSANTVTISAPISGLSSLTLGGGNTVWSGANSHSGTAVAAGKLSLSGSGTLGSSSASVSASSATIDLGGSSQTVGAVTLATGAAITNGAITGTSYDLQSGTIDAVVGGAVSAMKSTPDTVILSADNTFSGTMVISNGTLQIGAGGASGKLNPTTMVISNEAALVFNSSGSQTNSGQISGAGPISVLGGGSVRLSKFDSSFIGNILVDGSALSASGAANNFNAVIGPLGNPSVVRTLTLTNSATLTLASGNILGSGTSTRCGLATLVNPGCQLVLNANDANVLGPVVLNSATMSVGNGFSSVYQAGILLSNVVVEGTSPSTIITTGGDATRNGLMLGASGTDATADFGQSGIHFVVGSTGSTNADLTVSARLVDCPNSTSVGGANATSNGGLYKEGSGTMSLTEVNTYTGPTIIAAGKLAVSSVQGAAGMTNYVAMADSTALGVVVSGTNRWSPASITTAGAATFEFTGLINTSIAPLNPSSLSLASTVPVNVYGALSVGTYPLIANAAGSIGSFSLGTLPAGAVATLGTAGGDIVLNVTTGTTPSTPPPTQLTNSVSGSTLTLSWPAGQGWKLQVQTNSRSVGLNTNWFEVSGSSSLSSTNITVDTTQPTVFYRLAYP